MAPPKQVQKTRTKATTVTTKTVVTQKQSQEFVQTLLHSALSSLTYLREFFAQSAYDGRVLGSADRLSYRDYADAKLPTDKSRAKQPYRHVQILRRDRGERVNMLLDWLEHTAFPALREGRLRALQLCIHVDPNNRERVVETYTFTIDYYTNEQGEQVAGIALNSPSGRSVTVESSFGGMQSLLDELMKICKNLPSLPPKRFISMNVFMRDDPSDEPSESPEGFVLTTSNGLRFGQGDGWVKDTISLGNKMSSGLHGATLRISHLHHPAFDGIASQMRIPAQLEYNVRGSKTEEIADVPDADMPEPTPSTIVDSAAPGITSNTFGSSPAARQDLDSQISNVPIMKGALQGMMQPERLTQGDTQTPGPMTVKTPARPAKRSGSKKLTLIPEELSRLEKDKARLTKAAKKMGTLSENNDIVLCQCGFDGEEDEMINCSFCDTWQHLRCYGYSGGLDPRIPDTHACFHCLFGSQKEKMKTMQDLAQKRRAMGIALKDGLKRKGGIAQDMGVDTKTAGEVHAYLRGQGYIMPTAFSHKPGFGAKGLPFWVPEREGPAYGKMLADLFDPFSQLEGQYYVLDGATPIAASKELRALKSPKMPEGATPKSSKKKTRTPSTVNLDEITDFQTPFMPASFSKRGRDEEDTQFPTPKRQAMTPMLFRNLKGFQSEYLLSADGKSSPANGLGQTILP